MAAKKKKKSYRRKGSSKKMDTKNLIDGFLAEIGPSVLAQFVGENYAGIATHAAIGYFRKNPIAWYKAGQELAQMVGTGGIPGLGGGNGGNSGLFGGD